MVRDYQIESLRGLLYGVRFKVRTKSSFETREDYLWYLRVCNKYRVYLNREKRRAQSIRRRLRKGERLRDGFWGVPRFGLFKNYKVRDTALIETKFRVLGELGKVPIDTQKLGMSLDDFVVHLTLLGDTFEKTGKEVLEDLREVSDEEYFRVLDTIFYNDILVEYLYRIRKQFLIYLNKGAFYTTGRVTNKLYRRLDLPTDKYFTLREKKILESRKKLCLIRDRVRFYKDYYL